MRECFFNHCNWDFSISKQTHVSHLTPALVVGIRSVGILSIEGWLHSQLGIIWVVRVELALSLKCCHMLSVNLETESPEDTLPNEASLGISNSQIVFIIHSLWCCCKVMASCIVEVTDNTGRKEGWPELEPTFWVHIVKCEIRLTLHGPPYWESVRSVFFGKDREGVDNIWCL